MTQNLFSNPLAGGKQALWLAHGTGLHGSAGRQKLLVGCHLLALQLTASYWGSGEKDICKTGPSKPEVQLPHNLLS